MAKPTKPDTAPTLSDYVAIRNSEINVQTEAVRKARYEKPIIVLRKNPEGQAVVKQPDKEGTRKINRKPKSEVKKEDIAATLSALEEDSDDSELSEVETVEKTSTAVEPEASKSEKQNGALTVPMFSIQYMQDYYEWSRKQAKFTFWVAIGACIVGVLVIILASLLPLLGTVDANKVWLTTIGGVVTEVFAGTILIVYRSSLIQLNYYHKSLHEDLRYLGAVDLLWRFYSDTAHDNALADVITNSMKINYTVAQQREDPVIIIKPSKTDESGDQENNPENTQEDAAANTQSNTGSNSANGESNQGKKSRK